jgi:hypothetical protein
MQSRNTPLPHPATAAAGAASKDNSVCCLISHSSHLWHRLPCHRHRTRHTHPHARPRSTAPAHQSAALQHTPGKPAPGRLQEWHRPAQEADDACHCLKRAAGPRKLLQFEVHGRPGRRRRTHPCSTRRRCSLRAHPGTAAGCSGTRGPPPPHRCRHCCLGWRHRCQSMPLGPGMGIPPPEIRGAAVRSGGLGAGTRPCRSHLHCQGFRIQGHNP